MGVVEPSCAVICDSLPTTYQLIKVVDMSYNNSC